MSKQSTIVFSERKKDECFMLMQLLVCLNGFEPDPIYTGPVQVSPE